jgi:hypothetical protein
MKPILDWGQFNWCVWPALYVGVSERNWWVYLVWLRGRAGFYRFEPK